MVCFEKGRFLRQKRKKLTHLNTEIHRMGRVIDFRLQTATNSPRTRTRTRTRTITRAPETRLAPLTLHGKNGLSYICETEMETWLGGKWLKERWLSGFW